MSHENNALTRELLTNAEKALQTECEEHCNAIGNNASRGIETITPGNYNDRKLSYIESLTKNIENDETPIITDANANTSQFLNEITEKIGQLEELTLFTLGAVKDVERENERLRTSIKIVEEARSRPWRAQREVRPEHLQAAKRKFQMMKAELQGLIHSLFPDAGEAMTAFLGELMTQNLDEESSGYVQITDDNYHLVQLLQDKNIVSTNPYNKMEVKLAF